jgi:hypothetical protein
MGEEDAMDTTSDPFHVRNGRKSQLDVVALHSRQVEKFDAEFRSVPLMREQLSERITVWKQRAAELSVLRAKVLHERDSPMQSGHEHRLATLVQSHNDALDALQLLKKTILKAQVEIDKIVAGEESNEYLLAAIPYLNAHHAYMAEQITLETAIRRSEGESETLNQLHIKRQQIRMNIHEYVEAFNPELLRAVDKMHHDEDMQDDAKDICRSCNSLNIVEADNSYYVCGDCGVVDALGFSRTNVKANMNWEDTPIERRKYTYKRLNHFREYLRQIQGESRTCIPEDIYTQLRVWFRKYYIPVESINSTNVRLMLRRIHKSSYYEHREAIAAHLNPAYQPITIDTVHQEKMCLMFVQLEGPFECIKAKNLFKEPRKNFLSYPFVFFKLNELCGWDQYNTSCDLLKSIELMNLQDRWWVLMMAELGWEVVGRTFDVHKKHV